MASPPLRVVIADDSALLREGIARLSEESGGAVVAVIVLGVMCTGVTFHLTYRMIADEGATTAASVSYLLPVVSVALGVLVVHEHVSVRELAGMVVVLIGVTLVKRGGGSREDHRHRDLTSMPAAR